ncbi:DMT family transporter [Bacillus taeanensis]|uniref:EamA-like transporter family protein n=1 Tax=Bacillus taeanensis TaxID=273032 RepID=A0A366XR19_9BACI|nr:DMT family transporter [Bacillus taeanensis]RBW68582.1 EamA-like transporter family protein [Bacillus taeanensis]
MVKGIVFSLLAGVLIAVQGIFNTNVSSKAGLWLTTTIVHGVGLIGSVIIYFLVKDGSIKSLFEVNKVYLLGGLFGVIIVFSVMQGITHAGPAFSVSVLLISQLLIALLINTLGLFGIEPISLSLNKIIGVAVMIGGIVIFQFK